MEKAYSYRFYPTPEQESLLRRTLGCVRLVYNKALHVRTQAWYERQAAFLGQCAHESANFTALKENLNYSAEGLTKANGESIRNFCRKFRLF